MIFVQRLCDRREPSPVAFFIAVVKYNINVDAVSGRGSCDGLNIGEIYRLAVEKGIENDLRGPEKIEKLLYEERKAFEKLSGEEKEYFDQDRLFNPFHDTRILYGDQHIGVSSVLAGIDVEVEELLLADSLRAGGESLDLVISHHPEGKAMANLYLVMHSQEDLYVKFGVPVNAAGGAMAGRIGEVKRGLLPRNHSRAVDAAGLLDLPFMCVHSAADNHVAGFLQKLMDASQPETLADIIGLLKEIPEYRESVVNQAAPAVFAGKERNRAGRVMVSMAGGTSGSDKIFESLARAGVGTVLVMHIPEKNRLAAEKHHINVVVAGHMASDSLGMNLFLDELQMRGVAIKTCSGLFRHSRVGLL
jgi:hypothetical protein